MPRVRPLRLAPRAPWIVALVALSGCAKDPVASGAPPDAGPGFEDCVSWACPVGWVALAAGGCGPALLACQPDGGAEARACDSADGGASEAGASSWALDPSGAIRGPWPDPDDPDSGVPARDWSPQFIPEDDFAPNADLACPTGWRRLPSGVCDPQPGACRDGAFALPAGGCTATGVASCHDDTSATALGVPEGAVVRWVRAAAPSSDADGSFDHPFGSVSSALRDAPDDAWIALRDGTYDAAVVLSRSAHIIGGCAARVTLSAPPDALSAVSLRGRARLELRGVTVRGGVAGVSVDEGADLQAIGVAIEGSARHGVAVASPTASASLRDVAFSSVATGASPPPDAAAIAVTGGRAAVDRCHFEGLGASALRATDGASVTVADTLVDGAAGIGVDITNRASAQLTRVSIARARYAALSVVDASATVTDLVTRDGVPDAHGFNRGLYVAGGGTLRAWGLSVVNPVMTGLMVDGPGTFVSIDRGVFVGGTMERCHRPAGTLECSTRFDAWRTDASTFLLGETVRVSDRASLGARRLALVDGEGTALHVVNATASVEGFVAARYRGQREGYAGFHAGAAVEVLASARATSALTLREALIEDNQIHGLQVAGDGASVIASRLLLRDSHAPSWDGALSTGFGAVMDQGGTLRAFDSRFERNEQCGACALTRGHLIAERSVFADTVFGAGVGNGSGVIAQRESEVLLRECVVASNQRAGVVTIGGHIVLDRCVVRDTLPHPPEQIDAVPVEHQARAGVGVFVETGGRIELTATRVSGNRGLGVGAIGAAASARVDRCLVVDNEGPRDAPARGVEAVGGARVDVTSSLIANNEQIGAMVVGAGSLLTLVDVAIRATRPDPMRLAGFGLQAVAGGRAELDRVWVDGSTRVGASVTGENTRASLRDVMITDVRSVMVEGVRSQGFGVYASEGATLVGERVAVSGAGGAAIASTFVTAPARVDLNDVYVRDVRDAQIRSMLPLGRPVSYGLHVSGGAQMRVQRAAVIDTGYAFTRIGGSLDITSGVLTRARSEAGSSTGAGVGQGLSLRATCSREPTYARVATDQTLPAAFVDTRTPGCALPPCPATEEAP